MIKLLFFILISSIYSAEETIRYSLFPYLDKIEIELFFQSENQLPSIFILPDKLDCIDHLESPSHQFTVEEDKIRVEIKNNDPIMFRYSYKIEDTNSFEINGEDLFVIPDLKIDHKIPILLEWQKIPSDWTIANSYGIQENHQKIDSLSDLITGIYLLGKFSLASYEDNIHIASQNGPLPFDKIHNALQTIIKEHKKFWNDFKEIRYLVVVPAPQESQIDAYAKKNAFVIRCTNLNRATDKEWQDIIWVFSHEYFHNWNPYSALPAFIPHFDELGWFIEGFTDYYATYLLYKAGIFTFDQCIDETYAHLEAYHQSPYRNITSKEFIQKRTKDPMMQNFHYQQGYVLALLWDDKIRSISKGELSLDHFMRSLFKSDLQNVTSSTIGHFAKGYMGDTAIFDLERYILQGETIPTSPTLYGQLVDIYTF